jgi:hypothetical protein
MILTRVLRYPVPGLVFREGVAGVEREWRAFCLFVALDLKAK